MKMRQMASIITVLLAAGMGANAQTQEEKDKAAYVEKHVKAAAEEAKQGRKPNEDPISAAAHATGEPSLQAILDNLGYSVDTVHDEIHAERFRKAGKGNVTHEPIASYGLIQICTGGWYLAPRPLTAKTENITKPEQTTQWKVDAMYNKQLAPPLMPDARTTFDPGTATFGLWVSTAGFKDETVYTQDALQVLLPRFKPNDRHKALVYPAKKGGKLIPNTYIIGWEYSTNNDFQDIVTIVRNVTPITAEK